MALEQAWIFLKAEQVESPNLCQICFGSIASMLANVQGQSTPACETCARDADINAGSNRTQYRSRSPLERLFSPPRKETSPSDETPQPGKEFKVTEDYTAEQPKVVVRPPQGSDDPWKILDRHLQGRYSHNRRGEGE